MTTKAQVIAWVAKIEKQMKKDKVSSGHKEFESYRQVLVYFRDNKDKMTSSEFESFCKQAFSENYVEYARENMTWKRFRAIELPHLSQDVTSTEQVSVVEQDHTEQVVIEPVIQNTTGQETRQATHTEEVVVEQETQQAISIEPVTTTIPTPTPSFDVLFQELLYLHGRLARMELDGDDLREQLARTRLDGDQLRARLTSTELDGDQLRARLARTELDGNELREQLVRTRLDGDQLRARLASTELDGNELREQLVRTRLDGDQLRARLTRTETRRK
ncbi:hypothetical protein AKO1_002733 [Acrasis kona]|uniref:Uncharacterized protein n=1 Tax=Acrasis kona TaxID=1008807 RepID=A0AAW2YIC1_9EUKA